MKKFLILFAAALVGVASLAGAAAQSDDHPFRTVVEDRGTILSVATSTCQFISTGDNQGLTVFDPNYEVLANGQGVPVVYCGFGAHEVDIDKFSGRTDIHLITTGTTFFAIPEDVRLSITGFAHPAGLPDGVSNAGELRRFHLEMCANAPTAVIFNEVWQQGSVWCQSYAGISTPSFSTQ